MELIFTKTHPCSRCNEREAQYLELLPDLKSKFPDIKFSQNEDKIKDVKIDFSPSIYMIKNDKLIGLYLPSPLAKSYIEELELWIYSFIGIPRDLLKDYTRIIFIKCSQTELSKITLPQFPGYKYLINLGYDEISLAAIDLKGQNLPAYEDLPFEIASFDQITSLLPPRIKPDFCKKYLILTTEYCENNSPDLQINQIPKGIFWISHLVELQMNQFVEKDFTIIDLSNLTVVRRTNAFKDQTFLSDFSLKDKIIEYSQTQSFDNRISFANDLQIPTVIVFKNIENNNGIENFYNRIKLELENLCVVKLVRHDSKAKLQNCVVGVPNYLPTGMEDISANVPILISESGDRPDLIDFILYEDKHSEDIFDILRAKLNIWRRNQMTKIQ